MRFCNQPKTFAQHLALYLCLLPAIGFFSHGTAKSRLLSGSVMVSGAVVGAVVASQRKKRSGCGCR